MAQSPDPDLTVVLMGRSGVGKSASGNTILGQAAFKLSGGWGPMTMGIQQETGTILGKLIRVIDTPGIVRSKEKVKTCCQGLLQSSTPLLFLVLVTTGRFTDEEEEAVQAAITVLGDEGLANSFLLFTGGDELNVSLQDHISQSKRSPLQDVVKKFGDRYHLFTNEEPKDKGQVGELLRKAERHRTRELLGFKAEGFSIVLLGNTAVGKSASANTIIGRAAFESRASLKAVTTGIGEETGQRFGKRITVIDTPGLLGSEELIEKYYLGLPRSSTPVLLSLVVVRVGRFTEEDRRAVETAIRVLGPRRFENSYLLFTGGDALKDKSLQDFVSEDEAGPLHQVVQRFAGRTHLFNNEGGGREQVRELLQKAADRLMASLTLVDRRVILIGLSGGGRSSAGNTILGSERFPTGCGFEPVPAEVVSGSAAVEGCWITVVDTPGFTARDSDEDQLEKRLGMIRKQSDPGPHAVVFVVRIGRMSREDSALLTALIKMFYNHPSNFSMVLFTHGDELRGRSIDQMIQSNSCVSALVSVSCGRFCVFDNNQKGNRKQVREFLHHVENIISEKRGEHLDLYVRSTGINWLSEEREQMKTRHMHMHRDMDWYMHRDMPMSMSMRMLMLMHRDMSMIYRPRTTVQICCGCFCSTASRLDKLFRELNV
ncbi:GTPase IMAP family member 8 [Haplochromis burtoni]|uniref:GTPase IMAP family member 8 n=1 Tax=Haplochromis burtoni TaxID=8153 RepID=UPI0003BC6FFA|nr:GTPase IMAP family member 8 [Haplochromis burtoni]